jgi:hypothetical protein
VGTITASFHADRLVVSLHIDACIASFLSLYINVYYTQNVPGAKVNILGGHSIGHFKQKNVYVHESYSERFPR